MKCKHCSKVCGITRGIIKHVSAYKVQQRKARCTVLRDTLYNTNHFPETSEAEAILEPVEKGDYESPHLDNFDKKYPGNNDENTKMQDVKHITPISDLSISDCTTSTQLRSDTQSIWIGFKSLKCDDNQGRQAGKPVRDEDTMTYREVIPVDVDNDCHPSRHGVDSAWAKLL